jgi:hypothetical protein
VVRIYFIEEDTVMSSSKKDNQNGLTVTICWWADACSVVGRNAKLEHALAVNCTIGLKLPGLYKSPIGTSAYRFLHNAGGCTWGDAGIRVGYGEQDDFTDIPVEAVIEEETFSA